MTQVHTPQRGIDNDIVENNTDEDLSQERNNNQKSRR